MRNDGATGNETGVVKRTIARLCTGEMRFPKIAVGSSALWIGKCEAFAPSRVGKLPRVALAGIMIAPEASGVW